MSRTRKERIQRHHIIFFTLYLSMAYIFSREKINPNPPETVLTNSKCTPLELYKLLPRTNCGKCIMPSCLAFAAALVAGSKKPGDCPELNRDQLEKFTKTLSRPDLKEIDQAQFLNKLEKKMPQINFTSVAPLIGASIKEEKLVINSLGRDFFIDQQGTVTSECHIIPWVKAPLLSYITHKTHGDITGNWISFREIKGGIDWQGLFTSRCEMPLKKLADENPNLLTDLIDLFMGKNIDWYQADIALILYPLPKVPILICYQAPEDDLDSALTIFFDECCTINLHIKSIYTLCAGLVQMFTKIAEHHR